jgi:hypothetical protein
MEGGGMFDDLTTWWRNVGRDDLGYPKPWNMVGRYRTNKYYPPARYVAPLPQTSDVNAQAAVNQLNQSIMELQTTYSGVYNAAAAMGNSNGEISQTVANISALVNDVHSHIQALYNKVGSLTQLRNNVTVLMQQNDQLMATMQNNASVLERLKADRASLEQTSAGLLNNIVNATTFINNMKASLTTLNMNSANTPQLAATLRQIMNQLRVINGTIMTVDGSGAAGMPAMGMPYAMPQGMGMAQPYAMPQGMGMAQPYAMPQGMGMAQPYANQVYNLGQLDKIPYGYGQPMPAYMNPNAAALYQHNMLPPQLKRAAAAPGMPAPVAEVAAKPGESIEALYGLDSYNEKEYADAVKKDAKVSVASAHGSTPAPSPDSNYNYHKDYDENMMDLAEGNEMIHRKGVHPGADAVYQELANYGDIGKYKYRNEQGEPADLKNVGDFGNYPAYIKHKENRMMGDYKMVGNKLIGPNMRLEKRNSRGELDPRGQQAYYAPYGKNAYQLHQPSYEISAINNADKRVINPSVIGDVGTASDAAIRSMRNGTAAADFSDGRPPSVGVPAVEPRYFDVNDKKENSQKGREAIAMHYANECKQLREQKTHLENELKYYIRFVNKPPDPYEKPLAEDILSYAKKEKEQVEKKLAGVNEKLQEVRNKLIKLFEEDKGLGGNFIKNDVLKQALVEEGIIPGKPRKQIQVYSESEPELPPYQQLMSVFVGEDPFITSGKRERLKMKRNIQALNMRNAQEERRMQAAREAADIERYKNLKKLQLAVQYDEMAYKKGMLKDDALKQYLARQQVLAKQGLLGIPSEQNLSQKALAENPLYEYLETPAKERIKAEFAQKLQQEQETILDEKLKDFKKGEFVVPKQESFKVFKDDVAKDVLKDIERRATGKPIVYGPLNKPQQPQQPQQNQKKQKLHMYNVSNPGTSEISAVGFTPSLNEGYKYNAAAPVVAPAPIPAAAPAPAPAPQNNPKPGYQGNNPKPGYQGKNPKSGYQGNKPNSKQIAQKLYQQKQHQKNQNGGYVYTKSVGDSFLVSRGRNKKVRTVHSVRRRSK